MNPSFGVTVQDAQAAIRRMELDPRELPRPVVLIGGMLDPGASGAWMESRLRALSIHSTIINVTLIRRLSFAGYRDAVLDGIDGCLPVEKKQQRSHVDVIGFSLGGLVARHAAMPGNDGRAPLNIARLFTISSPLGGSVLAAKLPLLSSVQGDLRSGSERLVQIDNAPRHYSIYPYVRLGDAVVGAGNAAPPGDRAWWVHTPLFDLSHAAAPLDPRIFADIALRLRGEAPFSTLPRAPLPA